MGKSDSVQALGALFRDYLKPISSGDSASRFLEASFHPDVQAGRLTAIIEGNPLYSHYLQRLDILQEKVQKWREEFPEDTGTERLTQFIVALLGTRVTRNAILSIWIARHASQSLPRKEGAPFLVLPSVHLRYALSVSEYCDEHQLANKELTYLAGVCFDAVGALIARKGGVIKTETKYLEETWSEAIKAARIAYELSAIPKNLALSRFAFPATLLINLAKVLMAVSFPKKDSTLSWKEFLKLCEAHEGRSALAQLILEKKKFAFTHAEAAALLTSPFAPLHEAEKAIRHYQEPYLLRTSDRNSFHLGAILSIAMILAKTRSGAGLTPQPKEWLRTLGISDLELKTALARALKGA